jgi:propanol-preferring alcohol dehydrogenase
MRETDRQGSKVVPNFVIHNVPTSIEMLRKRRKLVMVGLFGSSSDMNLALIPLRAYTLSGELCWKIR